MNSDSPELLAAVHDPAKVEKELTRLKSDFQGFERIAFIGRSNVGKSSLLNSILQAKIARVSSEPGKTRGLYFYKWPTGKKVLVDLPGYGFAKGGADKKTWKELIQNYLTIDPEIDQLLLLIDSRHGPTKSDLEALEYLNGFVVPTRLIFTKWDQVKPAQRHRRQKEVGQTMTKAGFELIDPSWISIKEKRTLDVLIRQILS